MNYKNIKMSRKELEESLEKYKSELLKQETGIKIASLFKFLPNVRLDPINNFENEINCKINTLKLVINEIEIELKKENSNLF